jgi:parallel beta-helix repeat protein
VNGAPRAVAAHPGAPSQLTRPSPVVAPKSTGPPRSARGEPSYIHGGNPLPRYFGTGFVWILPNGSLSDPSVPITQAGQLYTLTANLSNRPIIDERNGSTLNGAGYSLRENESVKNASLNPFALVLSWVSGVTVEDLTVVNALVLLNGTHGATLEDVTNPTGRNVTTALLVLSSTDVTINNCRFLERNDSQLPNGTFVTLFQQWGTWNLSPSARPAGDIEGTALAIETSAQVVVENTYVSGLVGAWFASVDGLTLPNDTFNGTVQGITIPPTGPPGNGYDPVKVSGAVLTGVLDLSATKDVASAPALGTEFYTVPGALTISNSTNGSLEDDTWIGGQPIGLSLVFSQNFVLLSNDGNSINGASFVLANSQQLYLQANNATHAPPGSVAFELSNILSATLFANNASSAGTGVFVSASYDVDLVNNSLASDTSRAIALQSDDLCSVTGNDLTGDASPNADGISVANSTRLSIANNSIGDWSGNGSGAIVASELTDSTLAYNLASGAPVGVSLASSFNDTLVGNLIQDGGTAVGDAAVLLNDSGSLQLVHNNIQFDRTGVLAAGGGDTLLLDNNLSFDSADGVRWSGFDDISLAHNYLIDDGVGIDLSFGSQYSITDNVVTKLAVSCSPCVGISLDELFDGSISGNNLSTLNQGLSGYFLLNLSFRYNAIYNAGPALLVGDVTNLTVADNHGANDLSAIEVDNARNVLLLNNSFADSVVEGFELMSVVNATLVGNTAANSGGDGIALWSSSDLTLRNNTLVGDQIGLRAENSTGILAEANAVGNCNVSFRLNSVVNATFFHNNFELNADWNLLGDTAGLRWDDGYPIGGNFWSNATGSDTNSGPNQNIPGADGILDQPFPVRGFGMDRYPLLVPWANPSVQFLAQGLPAGTPWTLTFTYGGAASGAPPLALTGNGSTAPSLSVPFGAWVPFTYRVGFVAGFVPEPRTGGRNTSSGALTLLIPFTPFLLPLSFNESGLDPGTNWSVTVGGRVLSGSTGWLNLSLPNGSYAYSVAPIPGYYALSAGTVGVNGAPLARTLTFVGVTFLLTFDEFGLPNGTQWTVDFGGTRYTVVLPELSFELRNGSYAFGIPRVAGGYESAPANGSVAVRGQALLVRVAFTGPPSPPPPTPAAPSNLFEYAFFAVLAAAVVLGVLALLGWRAAGRSRGGSDATGVERAPAPPEREDLGQTELEADPAGSDYAEPPP